MCIFGGSVCCAGSPPAGSRLHGECPTVFSQASPPRFCHRVHLAPMAWSRVLGSVQGCSEDRQHEVRHGGAVRLGRGRGVSVTAIRWCYGRSCCTLASALPLYLFGPLGPFVPFFLLARPWRGPGILVGGRRPLPRIHYPWHGMAPFPNFPLCVDGWFFCAFLSGLGSSSHSTMLMALFTCSLAFC